MVRLKLYSMQDEVFKYWKFQSHNGSIKTYGGNSDKKAGEIFQSHNGSIKTCLLNCLDTSSLAFQSHNGSIKTHSLV